MKKINVILIGIILLYFFSCEEKYSNQKIKELLRSNDKEDLIKGAFLAGETGEKEFIPLLLINANNPRGSINIHFKGFTVYQEKMIALRKIMKVEPPSKITAYPDSSIIIFYSELAKQKGYR